MTKDFPRKLVLGTAVNATLDQWDSGQAQHVIETALLEGFRRFDTSALYGGGLAEERLGEVLRSTAYPGVRITTKCGRYRAYGAQPANQGGTTDWRDYSASATRLSVERSIERLGVARLDAVFIHDPEGHFDEALEGAYPALRDLQGEGLIAKVGVATNFISTLQVLMQRASFDTFMLANSHSLLDPASARDVLNSASQGHIEAHIAGPFLSGILATGSAGSLSYRYGTADSTVIRAVARLEAIAAKWQVLLRHCALQFLLRDEHVHSVVLGASTADQVADSVALARTELPDGFWADVQDARGSIQKLVSGDKDATP